MELPIAHFLSSSTSLGSTAVPLTEPVLPWPGPLLQSATTSIATLEGIGGIAAAIAAVLLVALVIVVIRMLAAEQQVDGLEKRAARAEDEARALRDGLDANAAQLSATLDTILEAIINTDLEGRITSLSPTAEALIERRSEEASGELLSDLLPLRAENEAEANFDPVAELREHGSQLRFDGLYHYERGPGRTLYLEVSGAPTRPGGGETSGFALALRDVTDRQTIETELAKAQKLESLGLLAGGIAHDFNNLLTIMMGNFSLLQSEDSLPDDLREPIDEAEKALMRARGLADQLLTFSSGGAPRTRSSDLAEIVRESASFVFRGAKSRCKLELPAELPPVDVDPEQISQVFANLLINARQALGEEGSVYVRAEAVKIGLGKTKIRPGSYVRVTVTDEGEGIPEEALPKIFDPYFTTKKGGSGLGLATSYSIIKRHRGLIQVESELGEGATFTLLLRTAKGPVERKPEETQASSSGRGRVLVMDDEHSILALLSAALKRLGFEAVTTTDGKAAIEACREGLDKGKPFQLAILDLTIPGGMGGVETAAELGRIQPSLQLVASSGYAQNPALIDFKDYGFHQVLVKPYRIPDLAKLLDSMLG